MKKSIKKQIIARILSEPYKASEHLCTLGSIINERDAYEMSSRAELKAEFLPSISYFIGKDFKPVNIDSITKLVEDIEKTLVKRINIISHKRNSKNFYELTSLLIALDYLNNYGILKNDKLVKNDKVLLCYNLVLLITNHCEDKEIEKWFNKWLKELKFN